MSWKFRFSVCTFQCVLIFEFVWKLFAFYLFIVQSFVTWHGNCGHWSKAANSTLFVFARVGAYIVNLVLRSNKADFLAISGLTKLVPVSVLLSRRSSFFSIEFWVLFFSLHIRPLLDGCFDWSVSLLLFTSSDPSWRRHIFTVVYPTSNLFVVTRFSVASECLAFPSLFPIFFVFLCFWVWFISRTRDHLCL